MNNKNISDVLIVGGGIVGCSAAYYLASKGIKTTVLEREDIAFGGSGRNGGCVRQSSRDSREFPLAAYAADKIWPSLSDMLDCDVEYCRQGRLILGLTDEDLGQLGETVKNAAQLGLEADILTAKEARKLNKYISERVTCAALIKADGHANPMCATLAFYKRARQLGAKFIRREKAVCLKKHKGKLRQVITQSNVYEAQTVILCAGYGTRKLARTVGIDIPMLPHLVEAWVTEAVPPVCAQLLGAVSGGFYGHQTANGSFVIGGDSDYEFFDSNYPAAVTRPFLVPQIIRGFLEYFPGMKDIKVIRTWSGQEDVSADHIPVISPVEEIPGLIIACGFSGHGFAIGPAAGLVLSQLAASGMSAVPIEPLRYDRFY